MSSAAVPTIYETFVDRLGLKSLFPAFMKTPSGKLKRTVQLEAGVFVWPPLSTSSFNQSERYRPHRIFCSLAKYLLMCA
jgi:hypothetical protein